MDNGSSSLLTSRRAFLCGTAAVAGAILMSYTGSAEAAVFTNVYNLGNTEVGVTIYRYGTGTVYFAPHSSEKTCVQAARAALQKHGGKLVQIINRGKRNITFSYKGVQYAFDPNRMFTDSGIRASLMLQGKTYSTGAHRLVHDFAFAVLVNIGGLKGKKLIALHNNTPGAYSLLSYAPGGELSLEVALDGFYSNTQMSPDDFFFVTTRGLFTYLKRKNYSVVLQDRSKMSDDGSMSVYCAKRGIPYVNVEAQAGHLQTQTKMITALENID